MTSRARRRAELLVLFAFVLALTLSLSGRAQALTEIAPDPSFGANGSAVLVAPGDDRVLAMTTLADRSVIVAGYQTIGGMERAVVCKVTSSGAFDLGFGSGGCSILLGATFKSRATAVAVDMLGRIVVAGTSRETGSAEGFVARLLANGGFDTTYDLTGMRDLLESANRIMPTDVTVLPDGSVVVAGSTSSTAPPRDFVLWKTTATGADDVSFNSPDGFVESDMGGDDIPASIAITSDFGFYVAGASTPVADSERVALAKYTAAGTLDSGFAIDGTTTWQPAGSTQSNSVSAVVQQGDRLVLGGDAQINGSRHTALARYLPSGGLDPSFGAGGTAVIADRTHNGLLGLEPAPDGRLMAVASLTGVELARFDANGILDSSYGRNGYAHIPLAGSTMRSAIDRDGRILLGGYALSSATGSDIRVSRVTSLTTPDPIPGSKILSPSKKRVPSRAFKAISGRADSGGSSTSVSTVAVAIRRKDAKQLKRSRCVWIRNPKGRSKVVKDKKRKCALPGAWMVAGGTTTWKLKLTRSLPPGKYVIYSRATLADGHRETVFSARAGNLRAVTIKK